MPVRASMAPIILRLRSLINDPASVSQQWSDSLLQDVLDASRQDVNYLSLIPYPTYSGSSLQYLDYYAQDIGDWEDDTTLFQYLTTQVTPSVSEPIVGHWQFATSTFPPVFLVGKTYDLYRSAADLLERLAASWVLSYDFSSDGQSFKRSQAAIGLQGLAKTYRMKQRAGTISMTRSDLRATGQSDLSLGPTALDYMSDGIKR